ncbi:ribosomal protection-like ABC-F family protein [Helicobacter mesocricetorum]|uniref:ribosomal protection-like ABC-F family protein n=1 Tax=Helicobacter mesocricetorum TaxID=87012 RepID=UPI000CF11E9C|nr:ABC-F family ATP-binding cassette domain-containing protein [Helicobacter mesocricetorum]
MANISLQNISKSFNHHIVLKDISLHIQKHQRVAIIGKNGAGKSTLLKILSGELQADEGEYLVENNLQIQALAQKSNFKENQSTKEAILESLSTLTEAKKTLEQISAKLQKEPNNPQLLDEHTKISNFINHHDAWDLDNKVQQILESFALKDLENQNISTLSGGEQKRVALACLLLTKPDVLLLDEPTNHLDIEMVEFLENLLLKEKWTLIFISHDRYFIDKVATRIIEVEDCKIREFNGGYRDYLNAKEALLKSLSKSHETLLKHLKSEEEWLSRGVRARVKRNEGRKERILKLREEAKKNPALIRKMSLELERENKHFNQTEGTNRKKMLFELKNISLGIHQKILFQDFSTRILAADKIAIVGKNGSGKSSFLKLLLGRIQECSGILEKGEIRCGYFDQHREMLDDSKDLLETFCPFGGDHIEVKGKSLHIFGYLKNFLFPKEFLDKKIGALSGGEKNRVALALLFSKEYDCLILDEPTNDLDIPTINILEEYLQSFQGALIFVSHDRYFVDKIAKKLFILKDKKIEESYRSFSEYLEIQSELKEYKNLALELDSPKKIQKPKTQTKLSYNEKRLLELLPKEIESLEQDLKLLEKELYIPQKNSDLTTLALEYENKKALCEEKITQYLELEEKMENL